MKKLNAAELRIGNYVNAEIGLPALDLHTIKSIDIRDIEKGIAEVYGIELTPEWLERAGFTYSESLTLWKMENSHAIYEYDENDEDSVNHFIHFYHNGKSLIIESTNDHGEYSNLMFKHIQYVHQLQNLYWCLCGQELTFKPTQL